MYHSNSIVNTMRMRNNPKEIYNYFKKRIMNKLKTSYNKINFWIIIQIKGNLPQINPKIVLNPKKIHLNPKKIHPNPKKIQSNSRGINLHSKIIHSNSTMIYRDVNKID